MYLLQEIHNTNFLFGFSFHSPKPHFNDKTKMTCFLFGNFTDFVYNITNCISVGEWLECTAPKSQQSSLTFSYVTYSPTVTKGRS